MFLKLFFIIFLLFSLATNGCEKPTMPSDDEWNNWLEDVKIEAIDNGIVRKNTSGSQN